MSFLTAAHPYRTVSNTLHLLYVILLHSSLFDANLKPSRTSSGQGAKDGRTWPAGCIGWKYHGYNTDKYFKGVGNMSHVGKVGGEAHFTPRELWNDIGLYRKKNKPIGKGEISVTYTN